MGEVEAMCGEIQRLATDEATFAKGRESKHYGSGKGDGERSDMVNDGEDWGELEYAALVERIKSVGEVWTEKMEECEKVRALLMFSSHLALCWLQKYHAFDPS